MELRSLVLFGLCLLAVSQCSEAKHSMHRRDTNDEDMFANDEATFGDQQNDEFERIDDYRASTVQPSSVRVQAKILTQPKVYEVREGEDVRLECNVDPDNGTVVQWSKGQNLLFVNRMKMVTDDRYSVYNDSKDLSIETVSDSDRGVFKCEVLQEHIVSIEHTLIVLTRPEIIRFSASNKGHVMEGQDLYLTCDVTGVPPPQIVWSRAMENGNQRLGEQDGEFSVNSVRIPAVQPAHSGQYYCYAFNGIGNSQAELSVHVAEKPRVHVHRTVVNSAINVEAILECSTNNFENSPHIRWYKDGVLIEDSSSSYIVSTRGSHSNLTVTPKSDADFGTFTCAASNSVASHNRSISLVQRPVVEAVRAEGGALRWRVRSHLPLLAGRLQLRAVTDGNSTWAQYEVPLPSTYSHKYDIKYDLPNLAPGKYEAFVMVQNENSWSESVEPVLIDIDSQPEYIQHASVYRGSNAHIIRPSSVVLSSILMYLLVRM